MFLILVDKLRFLLTFCSWADYNSRSVFQTDLNIYKASLGVQLCPLFLVPFTMAEKEMVKGIFPEQIKCRRFHSSQIEAMQYSTDFLIPTYLFVGTLKFWSAMPPGITWYCAVCNKSQLFLLIYATCFWNCFIYDQSTIGNMQNSAKKKIFF